MTKAEQDFKEWYVDKYYKQVPGHLTLSYATFINLPIEFRIGVYQKFYDEKAIEIRKKAITGGYLVFAGVDKAFHVETPEEAIDKAKELYNERNT